MLPTGVVYMPFLPSWREQFPGLEPVGLTATVIHLVPFLREIVQWLGGREVCPPVPPAAPTLTGSGTFHASEASSYVGMDSEGSGAGILRAAGFFAYPLPDRLQLSGCQLFLVCAGYTKEFQTCTENLQARNVLPWRTG